MTTTNSWQPVVTRTRGGYHRILVGSPAQPTVDVTFFRGVETQLGSYNGADPFGDGVAQLVFPQISAIDDLTSPELSWLHNDADVDIWWIPGMDIPASWAAAWDATTRRYRTSWRGDLAVFINPTTELPDSVAPAWQYNVVGNTLVPDWTKPRGQCVWQGFMSSPSFAKDDSSSTISMQCQGALFQTDSTLSKPSFPPRPLALERLIADQFNHEYNPSLRTHPLKIVWPDDWSYVVPAFTGSVIPGPGAGYQHYEYGLTPGPQSSRLSNLMDPDIPVGAKWTGYTTRDTGQWSHRLTDTVQGWLSDMIVKPGSGATAGYQWTLMMLHEGEDAVLPGRTPQLKVRNQNAAAAFSVWAAQPGVDLELTSDATQSANAIYGTGTDLGGVAWSNSHISSNGRRTDYAPLAASPEVYPPLNNPSLNRSRILREAYNQYGTGFSQSEATKTAAVQLARQVQPGYAGTITLSVDPSAGLSKWQIKPGTTMLLKGFLGTGDIGMRFHIAAVEADVAGNKVSLTVDTLYRDMLTLGEALERTRDPLTPLRMLQLNANSTTVEDIQAPWSYARGSGFVPLTSQKLYDHMPARERFPYVSWIQAHPPKKHPSYYVRVNANAAKSSARWSKPCVQIRMSERGSIRRSEFFVCDREGNILPIPFHVSLYYANSMTYRSMPTTDGKTFSPFLQGAFESIDPTTGQPWVSSPNLAGDTQNYVIGWGNYLNPAGYSPGNAERGSRPTGLLVDESTWSFDCSSHNRQYDQLAKAGAEKQVAISVWAMFYAEYTEAVYFGGRLYVSPPGTTS